MNHDEFSKYLDAASKEVASWPLWKQNILGRIDDDADDLLIANLVPPAPDERILKIIADVVALWDECAQCVTSADVCDNFVAYGGVQPLRDLIVLYGNPNKKAHLGVMDVK